MWIAKLNQIESNWIKFIDFGGFRWILCQDVPRIHRALGGRASSGGQWIQRVLGEWHVGLLDILKTAEDRTTGVGDAACALQQWGQMGQANACNVQDMYWFILIVCEHNLYLETVETMLPIDPNLSNILATFQRSTVSLQSSSKVSSSSLSKCSTVDIWCCFVRFDSACTAENMCLFASCCIWLLCASFRV